MSRKNVPPEPSASPKMPRTRFKLWHWFVVLLVIAGIVKIGRWAPHALATQALEVYDNQSALRWLEWSEWMRNDPGQIAMARVRAFRRLGNFELVRKHLLKADSSGISRSKLEREQWLTLAQAGQLDQIEAKLPELLGDPLVDPRDVCEAYVTGFLLTTRSGQALELIIPWLADFPHDAQAYYLRGQAHATGRHYAEAETALREARKLAPHRQDVALALAESLMELQQPQVALPLFQEATSNPVLSDQAWLGVAQAARRSGQTELALRTLRSLVGRRPELGAAWEEMGRIHLDQEAFEEARQSLARALELTPKSLSGRQALARTLMALGKPEQARSHLDFVKQATAAMEQIRLLEDFTELHPMDVNSRFEIAKLYHEYDTPTLAAAWARSVLLIEPEHKGAQEILRDLMPRSEKRPRMTTE